MTVNGQNLLGWVFQVASTWASSIYAKCIDKHCGTRSKIGQILCNWYTKDTCQTPKCVYHRY